MIAIDPAFVVLIILATVIFAALAYQPMKYTRQWQQLAERYELERRPLRQTYSNEHLLFGDGLSAFFMPWRRNLAEYARFDVELDDEGLWLLYDGPSPAKCPPTMLIPWARITFRSQSQNQFHFHVDAERPVPMMVQGEVGDAIRKRVDTGRESVGG